MIDHLDDSEPAQPGPKRTDWRLSCLLCSRGAELKLTAEEVGSVRQIQRCRHCGGKVFLSPVPVVLGGGNRIEPPVVAEQIRLYRRREPNNGSAA